MKSPMLMRPLFANRPRPGATDLDELSALLKVVAEPARMRILDLLNRRGQMTVTRLMPLLHLSQPAVSHHLAALRGADLVVRERSGREALYALNVDAMARVSELIHPRRRS